MFVDKIEWIGSGSVRPMWQASLEIIQRVTMNDGSYHKMVAEKSAYVTMPLSVKSIIWIHQPKIYNFEIHYKKDNPVGTHPNLPEIFENKEGKK